MVHDPSHPYSSQFPLGTPYSARLTAAKRRAKDDQRVAIICRIVGTGGAELDEVVAFDIIDALKVGGFDVGVGFKITLGDR
jgi:hypothetical protein